VYKKTLLEGRVPGEPLTVKILVSESSAENLWCLSQVLVLVCDSSTEKLVSELQFN